MSAWSARVLSGLIDELGEAFAESVRMISAVSGGLTGR